MIRAGCLFCRVVGRGLGFHKLARRWLYSVGGAAAVPKTDFDALISENSAAVYAYLWRLMGDAADAEDCLQDVCVRAYRAQASLDGHPNARAWLYRIATNTARTQLKQRGRARARAAPPDPPLAAA